MAQPSDDDSVEDAAEGGAEDEPEGGSLYWLGLSMPVIPLRGARVRQLRAGSTHLGSVFSSGAFHLAITHDGDVSEHGSHDAAIRHLHNQHGAEPDDRRYGNEANAY